MYQLFGHQNDLLYVHGSMMALIIVDLSTESTHLTIYCKHCCLNINKGIRPSSLMTNPGNKDRD